MNQPIPGLAQHIARLKLQRMGAFPDFSLPAPTARQIIEARLGRDLGPIAAMPKDERRALLLLGLRLTKEANHG